MCMEDDETLMLAPCGHGFCKLCWQGYISTAVVDGSTTQVQKGVEYLLDVSQLQCPGCKEEDKYQDPNPAPYLSLSFLQSICPPATSHSFNQRICEQLASKYLRSNLPGALCPCGTAIIGMFQVEFACFHLECSILKVLSGRRVCVQLLHANIHHWRPQALRLCQ
jgi:hypothetical protein